MTTTWGSSTWGDAPFGDLVPDGPVVFGPSENIRWRPGQKPGLPFTSATVLGPVVTTPSTPIGTKYGESQAFWTVTDTTAGKVTAKAASASVYTLTVTVGRATIYGSICGWGQTWGYNWANGAALTTFTFTTSGIRTPGPPPIVRPFVFTDAVLVINGVKMSDHVTAVATTISRSVVDVTLVGDLATRWAVGTITEQIQVTFFQDFAANRTHSVLSSLINAPPFPIVVKPTSAATSPTNPAYTAMCLFNGYSSLDAKVGEASPVPVTFDVVSPIQPVTA